MERGVIVSRASPPAMCLSSKPILPLSPLDWDSENCTSPPPVDLVSQQGAPEARGEKGERREGPSCLLAVPAIVTDPTVVCCAVLVAAAACFHLKASQLLAAPRLGGLCACSLQASSFVDYSQPVHCSLVLSKGRHSCCHRILSTFRAPQCPSFSFNLSLLPDQFPLLNSP